MSDHTRRIGIGTAVLLVVPYLLAVVALTWPLLPHAATHIAATLEQFHLIDTLQVAWVNAHETRALTTAPTTLLAAGTYHPSVRTLFYNTTSFGFLPYFAPTFLASGNPALALNLAFLVAVALSAWAIHVVVHRWADDHVAGAVAGWTFLMSRTSLWGFVSCAPLYAPLVCLPFVIYAAATPSSRLAAPAILGCVIALQAVADPLYIAPAMAVPLVAIALVRLRAPATRPQGLAMVGALAVAGVLLLPIYAGYADVVLRNPDLAAQSVWTSRTAASDGGVTLPLWFLVVGHVVGWWVRFSVPLLAMAIIAAGAIVGMRPRPAWLHCAFWVVAALLLPLAHSVLPGMRGLHRSGLTGLVALSLLAGLGFAACTRGLPGRWRGALATVTIVALFALPPGPGLPSAVASFARYPIQPAPAANSPTMDALRAGAGPVVEIPAGQPLRDSVAQYRSIFYRRPLLNGYSSYYPAAMPQRLQLIRRLPDADALRALRDETGIRTIVVHARELAPATRRAWEGPRPDALRLVASADDVLVFDVVDAPSP